MNTQEAIKKAVELIGKEVEVAEIFTGKDFEAVSKAEKYATSKGYNYGSMCRNEPIGLAKNCLIAKWRNISRSERSKLGGLLLSDDFRDGDVFVILFK